METSSPPIATGPDAKDPTPLAVRQSPLWRWVTPALSVAILAVVLWQFRSLQLDQIKALIPSNPLFWLVFALYYFAPILADFTIFRKLWGIPAEGLIALTRKLVSNELLFGYIGDAYFYSWARRKLDMATSPFGAVKDVAILSGLVGNACTLAMIAVAYPLLGGLHLNVETRTLVLSVVVLMVLSIIPIIFGKRLFSLSKAELWMIAGLHFARIVATAGLVAICWNLALPQVPLSWWVVLSTVRMLLSRLPLVTNKDLLFAGIAVLLVGREAEITALLTLMVGLTLTMHLFLGAALAIGDFVTLEKKR